MNFAPSTTELTPQRKRIGRPPKAAQPKQMNKEVTVEEIAPQSSEFSSNLETAMSRKDSDNIVEVEGAALVISPPLLNTTTVAVNPRVPTAIGECRRSSRKKIIKFDVRDLLNKHRKPHKIQIEARIDSNAPQTPKSSTTSTKFGGAGTTGTSVPASISDLSSKQKAFMEKSAIFRRISISEQQNKMNAPQLPPPMSSVPKVSMLSTINRKGSAEALATMDPAKIAQARRLSRTQEIFNASLMKSKQNSSLIVAQIESNSCSSTSSGLICQKISTPPPQKKSTNVASKRKSITNTFSSPISILDVKSGTPESGQQKRRGRPPKNKVPSAQNPNKTTIEDKNTDEHQHQAAVDDVTKKLEKRDTASTPTLNSATNWKEYKANLIHVANETQPSEPTGSRGQKPLQYEKKPAQIEDVILEISSTSSISEQETRTDLKKSTDDVKGSPQRNFASVCILQENAIICETANAPEFIIAAVEEITTENRQSDKSSSLVLEDHTSSPNMVNALEIKDSPNTTNISLDAEHNEEKDIDSDSFSGAAHRASFGSRKSSGSESESGGSDGSNKSYKKGDKLRVSLKRLTMSQTELTSTISLSSSSNSCSDDAIVGSGGNTSSNNNSGESNSTVSEISTVTTRSLPTRRSHRLPKKSGVVGKVESRDAKSNAKVSLKENLNITNQLKMTEGDVEKDKALPIPIDIITSNTAVKTDSDFESINKATNYTTGGEVEEKQLKGNVEESTVELSSKEVIEGISQSPSTVLDTVLESEVERKECDTEINSATSLLYENLPSTSNVSKKERITLPLKKQVSKFKMYEAAVHNVAANVETSTLLDILKTVKQNDLTLGTKTTQNRVELDTDAGFEQSQLQTLEQKSPKAEDNFPDDTTITRIEDILSNAKILQKIGQPTEVIIDIKSSTAQSLEENLSTSTENDSEIVKVQLLPNVDNLCKEEVAFKNEVTDTTHPTAENVDSSKEKITETITADECTAVETLQLKESTKTTYADKYLVDMESSIGACKSNTETKALLENVCQQREDSNGSNSFSKISNLLETTAYLEQQPSVSNELTTESLLDESSTEEINQITDSQPSSDEQPKSATKKTPSPTPSDNSTGQSTKKPTRRYERRSQRGDVSSHKTLEETFAEIAAESCKAVLDLKAKQVDIPEETKGEVTENVIENVQLEKDIEISSTSGVAHTVIVSAISMDDVVESNESSVNFEESRELAAYKDNTCLEKNIAAASTNVATNEILLAKELPSKVLAVQEDSENSSNHSSPSRRRRKLGTKKEVNKISTSTYLDIGNEANKISHKTAEVRLIEEKSHTSTNLTPEANATITSEQDFHTSTTTVMVVEESGKISHDELNATPEKVLSTISIPVIEEAPASISLETTIEIQQKQEIDVTTKISTDSETIDAFPKNRKERKEKVKSRMHKKGINLKVEQSADTEIEAKNSTNEMSGDVKQGETNKSVREEESTILKSREYFPQNTQGETTEPEGDEQSKILKSHEAFAQNTPSDKTKPKGESKAQPKRLNSPKDLTQSTLAEITKPEERHEDFPQNTPEEKTKSKGKNEEQPKSLKLHGELPPITPRKINKPEERYEDFPQNTLGETVKPEANYEEQPQILKSAEQHTQRTPGEITKAEEKCEEESKPSKSHQLIPQNTSGEKTKSKRKYDEQAKSLKSIEDVPQNISDVLKKVDEIATTTTSNQDYMSENKLSVDTEAQNLTCEMQEQRDQSGTPVGRPKKVKKRKSTKPLTDEKPADLKDSNSFVEETKTAESKEKVNETVGLAEKERKSRKINVLNEPNKDNSSDMISNIVRSSNTTEAIEKEALAKAPPKKRLLKQLEEKSAFHSIIPELPTTSAAAVDMKTTAAKKAASDSGKTKEHSHKKSKKAVQTSDDVKKRPSFESPKQSSMDEESRSATSTPVGKRFKQQKSIEKTPEDKAKLSSKRKPKLDLTEVGSTEKINIINTEIKDKEKSSSALKKTEKKKFLATEDTMSNELAKEVEEKNAKKKRQKRLKEAFEAALKDALAKPERHSEIAKETATAEEIQVAPLNEEKVEEPPPVVTDTLEDNQISTVTSIVNTVPETTAIASEPEEEPDPLKDIEKFIEDGVNLLKRGYKIEDDSVDEVICPKTLLPKNEEFKSECTKQEEEASTISTVVEGLATPNTSIAGDVTPADKCFEETSPTLRHNIYFETPADTPVATPTTTPPPKSPTQDTSFDEISGVRRSHRIKLITKTPKALVGRGLVREKERFSIKDDVEMKTHYSLDDHLTDLAQVEAKNAKFLKEMEERLSNFQVIKDNEYKCERVISREARKMLCDCFLTAEEEERGELGCGEDCLNRLLMIECGPDCNVKDRCTNKRFQKILCSPCRVFRTEKKGFGIMADIEILPGEFIMEYVGEVINGDEFERRRTMYSLDKNRHYYFMALRSDAIIDATIKGNISRFINHSCDPNAETQKWTVNGELRIGFFSRKSIMPGEEITFDYQYQRYGREAQRCYCESANCRGWIGEEPNSDEGEQIDEDSDADNLADGSDEDESDDSTGDTDTKFEIDTSPAKFGISTEDGKVKFDEKVGGSGGKEKKKKLGDEEHKEGDDETRAKAKKLSGKSADKVARKKNKNKQKKEKRLGAAASGDPTKTLRYLEDPDIEDEVKFLSRSGLRNQSDTLRFSRLVVRAKLAQTRLNLLKILRNGELPCRRLFLDYHGLRLLHGWMSEDGGDMAIRLSLLEALESLPIANKTVLTDSKVYQSVRNWCGSALPPASTPSGGNSSSPSDESSKESSSSNSQQEIGSGQEVPSELQTLAIKLTNAWNSLPEIFRIPKRERIEQMKEHEREADRQFAEASTDTSRSVVSDRYQRDRFGRGHTSSRYSKPNFGKDSRNSNISVLGSMAANDPRRRSATDSNNSNNESMKHLSKERRREMFAAKVARDEAEKRMAEERREFETKCRFFGLDPKKTRPQDVPFCVDPSTGQWYSVARQPIPTPPCYAHIQVQPKAKSTDPTDYKLPAVVSTLHRKWKYAITTLGQIYYYHVKQRIPQWHPPTPEQLRAVAEEADSSESESCEEAKITNESSEDDDALIGMDEAQLKALVDKKVENRRHKRYSRLVDERPISPRKEEDRIYNQMEMRKYKENKEKIRKRKEEIRRKRVEALKAATSGGLNLIDNAENPSSDATSSKSKIAKISDETEGAIPIQDYLLSSDEEEMMKIECNNSPLLDKIVQGDKIVDELDALTTKRALKRPLPPHRDLSTLSSVSSGVVVGVGGGGGSSSSSGVGGCSEHKRRKSDKKEKSKKSKDSDSKYRRNKEKFRCEIAGIIVQHLKPYRKESCILGRIQSDEDFYHLARKLTHFVMVKELKYCESVGQTLIVTESVKNKSREFIKKYMAKYGGSYVKPANDPEFKDIPFTI